MSKYLLLFLILHTPANASYFDYFKRFTVINTAPNFDNIADTNARKQEFFNYLKPIIVEQNQKILQLRNKIKYNNLSPRELLKLAKKYRTSTDDLLKSIDIIPTSLALTQAALESNWGRSRFAEYNNYYGIWCFKKGCGIVPKQREEGATHEVAIFTTITSAVRNYMWTLNSHPAYKKLRDIRYSLRENGKEIDGIALAEGLEKYSGIGNEYVKIVQKMIKYNKLQ